MLIKLLQKIWVFLNVYKVSNPINENSKNCLMILLVSLLEFIR